jgi:plastocyanin
MSRFLPSALAAVVAVLALAAGAAFATRSDEQRHALGPGSVTVHITIHHSRFQVEPIRVVPGTTVTFVVENTDAIGHELIVGDAEVHRRHEAGTEAKHDPRPGEITVPALSTAATTFDFPAVGSVQYACHLPGHLRYGMSGDVEVVAA